MTHGFGTIVESCAVNLMFFQESFGLGCSSHDFGREFTYSIEMNLFTVLVNTCCTPILELKLAGGRTHPAQLGVGKITLL